MANYLNKEGILYTQEEIEAAALENNVDVDTILADNELSLEGEKPGKPQSATAKKPTVVQEKPKSVSPSANTSSGWNTKAKPKSMGEQIVTTFQKQKKVQEKNAQSKKVVAKKIKEPDFNAARLRLAAQMGEADPNAVPGSFGYPAFKAAKKKEAKAEAVKEDERVDFESRMSGIVLRNNNEAKKWYEDNLSSSQLTESDNVDMDTYIESEIARNNTLQNTDGKGGYEINAAQSQEARMRAGASGNTVGTKKYQAFYDETE
jgi:hypothetical protein